MAIDYSIFAIPKTRPRALDKADRQKQIVTTDKEEDKKVKKRSGGRCEVFIVGEGRCRKHASTVHHMLGGWGRRARGRSALAEHKQHVCDGIGGHHPLITNHILRLQAVAGELPQWTDKYERHR